MIKRILLLIALFYILILLQSSFLVHFNISGTAPNLVLILVCLLSFFEKPKEYWGIFGAITGGFFLDIFLNSFIGISIIVLVFISLFIKESLRLLRETYGKHPIIYFLPLFILSLFFYDLLAALFFYFFNSFVFQFNFGLSFLVKIVYNSIFALLGFYLFKGFSLKFYGKVFKK